MANTGLFTQLIGVGSEYLSGRARVDIERERQSAAVANAAIVFEQVQSQRTTLLMFGGLAIAGLWVWRSS